MSVDGGGQLGRSNARAKLDNDHLYCAPADYESAGVLPAAVISKRRTSERGSRFPDLPAECLLVPRTYSARCDWGDAFELWHLALREVLNPVDSDGDRSGIEVGIEHEFQYELSVPL